MLFFNSRFPSGCKCYSQRLSETYNFMLVRSEAREAEVVGEEERTERALQALYAAPSEDDDDFYTRLLLD